MTVRERLRFEPTEESHRVTPLELIVLSRMRPAAGARR
jgi:hypothetical protein